MAFYVGQKVVCVEDRASRGILTRGQIYTVSKLGFLDTGEPGLDVEEDRYLIRQEVGWRRTRFRPVCDRPTDISIFKEMLNPSKTEVSA